MRQREAMSIAFPRDTRVLESKLSDYISSASGINHYEHGKEGYELLYLYQ